MAELPSAFWSGWIIVVTLASLAGVAWLTVSVYFSSDSDEESEAEPVWDNDLREGTNAPPMWWFWMLLGTLVVSLTYLMLFPGLGSYPGLLNWSQGSRVIESYENYEQRFEELRADIASQSLDELQNDLELMQTAERIYKRECSACHGPDARGQASLFPNLMDVDWQWGGSAEQIEATIRQGRNALMPAWQAVLGDDGVVEVADYVIVLGDDNAQAHPGKIRFDQTCAACHGVDGSGNALLGAPNLADNTWLYGNDIDVVRTSIAEGRSGIMPSFGDRLDELQIKLLVAMLAR